MLKHTIRICMGSSCFARGNEKNLKIIENYLQENQLEAEVELVGSRCENLCSEGPIIQINETVYHQVDSGSMIDLLNQLAK